MALRARRGFVEVGAFITSVLEEQFAFFAHHAGQCGPNYRDHGIGDEHDIALAVVGIARCHWITGSLSAAIRARSWACFAERTRAPGAVEPAFRRAIFSRRARRSAWPRT